VTIYFAFSDESGNYKQDRNHRFNQLNPYYIRASFTMEGDEWHYLDSLFGDLKKEYNIPPLFEVKYADLWTLQQYQSQHQRKLKTRLQTLIDYPVEKLKEFVERAIALLGALDHSQIVLTISKNDRFGTPSETDVLIWHIKNLMQRFQMDLESCSDSSSDNLGIIFLDPIHPKIDNLLTEAYNQLSIYGDRFMNFSSIKDCLHFEVSHHSCGIQIADYIAGITYGYLHYNREYNVGVFNRQIRPLLRESTDGKIMGYGIIEIPSDSRVRSFLSEQFYVD
jgi:hypothetical protein